MLIRPECDGLGRLSCEESKCFPIFLCPIRAILWGTRTHLLLGGFWKRFERVKSIPSPAGSFHLISNFHRCTTDRSIVNRAVFGIHKTLQQQQAKLVILPISLSATLSHHLPHDVPAHFARATNTVVPLWHRATEDTDSFGAGSVLYSDLIGHTYSALFGGRHRPLPEN